MRTPYVLVDDDLAGAGAGVALPLSEDRVHHLRTVLRRGDGDPVEVTDGAGHVADGVLVGDRVRLAGPVREVPAPTPTITVLHAVPKGRALDEIVRTLAELGVAEVLPVLTERTEARPTGDRARSVGDRLRAVARSALQQAHSAHMCQVGDPETLTVTLRNLSPLGTALVGHPDASTTLGARMATARPEEPIRLLVGPEGGMSEDELEMLAAEGWTAVTAGPTVLRTVHAATVLTAAVLAFSGRFGNSSL